MPTALRKLDDRVLGDRGKKHADTHEDAPHDEHADTYPDEPRTEVVEREERPRERKAMPSTGTGDGFREFLSIFARVSRAVFLALALVVGLGILFTVAPTNEDNGLVSAVLDIARAAAGPFRDVFTISDNAERELVVNYAFAAGIYLLLATLVTKIVPGKS